MVFLPSEATGSLLGLDNQHHGVHRHAGIVGLFCCQARCKRTHDVPTPQGSCEGQLPGAMVSRGPLTIRGRFGFSTPSTFGVAGIKTVPQVYRDPYSARELYTVSWGSVAIHGRGFCFHGRCHISSIEASDGQVDQWYGNAIHRRHVMAFLREVLRLTNLGLLTRSHAGSRASSDLTVWLH